MQVGRMEAEWKKRGESGEGVRREWRKRRERRRRWTQEKEDARQGNGRW